MEVKFTILGEPMGKERPKFRRVGNYVRTYTPAKTVKYEAHVVNSYSADRYLQGPVRAEIIAFYKIPESASKKSKQAMLDGTEWCLKKPDCDNIAKCILDALNNVAYDDDKQVVELYVEKHWSNDPRVEVTLVELTK